MKIDPHAEAHRMFTVRATEWERAEVPVEDIFHAFAQAFGLALSRYCAPETAVAFLRQELGRVERLAISPSTETRQ